MLIPMDLALKIDVAAGSHFGPIRLPRFVCGARNLYARSSPVAAGTLSITRIIHRELPRSNAVRDAEDTERHHRRNSHNAAKMRPTTLKRVGLAKNNGQARKARQMGAGGINGTLRR